MTDVNALIKRVQASWAIGAQVALLSEVVVALREQADDARQLRTALKAVRRWVETLPNAAGIPGFPLDDVDAALMEPKS